MRGVHIIDPEIILQLRSVTQATKILDGRSLGLLAREQAVFFLLGMGGENAPGGFGQFSDHLAFPVQQFFLDKGKQQQKNRQTEQDYGERHRKDDSHRYSARGPIFGSRMFSYFHVGIALSHPISNCKNERSHLYSISAKLVLGAKSEIIGSAFLDIEF